jgi:hypothetical protein
MYHTDHDMEKMAMIDPNTSGKDIPNDNSRCHHDFHHISGDMHMMYGDNQLGLTEPRKLYYD